MVGTAPRERLEYDVKRLFSHLTFPELKLAQRALQKLVGDRLAARPDESRREMVEYDSNHPGDVIFH